MHIPYYHPGLTPAFNELDRMVQGYQNIKTVLPIDQEINFKGRNNYSEFNSLLIYVIKYFSVLRYTT